MKMSKISTCVVVLVLLQYGQCAKVIQVTTAPPTASIVVSGGDFVSVGGTKPPPTLGTIPADRGPGKLQAVISPTPSPDPYNPNGSMCDIWAQDCPPGFKCITEDLGSEPRCRPLDDSPDSVGDQCSNKFDNDGDTCDDDGICIAGVCRELCKGSPGNPICEEADICHVYADGTPLCEDTCDPYYHQICGAGKYCTQDSTSPDGKFTCMVKPDLDPDDPQILGTAGKSCVETSQCQQAFACVSKNNLPNNFCHENAALSCCTPLAEDVDDCPNGMVLADFYEDAPPGFGHIKVCVLY